MGALVSCLDQFGCMAGLRTNILKFRMNMTSIDEQTKARLLQLIDFQEGEWTSTCLRKA